MLDEPVELMVFVDDDRVDGAELLAAVLEKQLHDKF